MGVRCVVHPPGLRGDDFDLWVQGLGREGDPGDHPAARDRDHDGVQTELGLLHQLKPYGCLAANRLLGVKRRNKVAALLPLNLVASVLPVLHGKATEGDVTAVALDRGDLDLGGVLWDHDVRRNPAQLGSQGGGLGVVAAGVGDHTVLRLLVRHGEDGVQGAPDLEAPGLLEHLHLEEELPTAQTALFFWIGKKERR